ncbi:flavodoxin/nitric oxide synthase [Pengzhenrongella sicca]|uniref:Flavodoxin/nitric oxide synthase n=1 Tax=Pengzhenrongella sicca TaxID=2819238 RepID=A0A8A4Z835_9MICO|nr:flavodoxin/nitric oxide synthase [Pengzhenrongella sicca]QTE27984.1 flavodoxin/nitric oxide synthase [Pengzhenrongella sicca]
MRALLIYESMFGNTRDVAQAVAAGLAGAADVQIVDVGAAGQGVDAGVDLLVLGGPTHAFGMSRPATRADAHKQAGHTVTSLDVGVREWLERLGPVPAGVAAATFDTRVTTGRVPGSAARAARRRLARAGCRLPLPAETFYVEGTTGPLSVGEVDRAHDWGEQLGRAAAATLGPTTATAG